MATIGPNASFQPVYTAPAPGIHVFTWLPQNNGNVQFNFPGDLHNPGPVWMEQGEQVFYKGPQVEFFGVRLPDEMTDTQPALLDRLARLEARKNQPKNDKKAEQAKEPE